MTLEELRMKRKKLENETNMCLSRMDSIIEESERAANLSHAIACGKDFEKYIGRL